MRELQLIEKVGGLEKRGGVCAAAAEPGAHRDALEETNRERQLTADMTFQLPSSLQHKVLARDRRPDQVEDATVRSLGVHEVVQRDRLHDGIDVVVAVGTPAGDVERQVELRISRQDQRHVVTTLIHPPLTVGGRELTNLVDAGFWSVRGVCDR